MLRCRAQSWHETELLQQSIDRCYRERADLVWPPAEGAVLPSRSTTVPNNCPGLVALWRCYVTSINVDSCR
jgi:hypothetical protein